MPAKKIDKPWGYEILLTESNLPYTSKIIHIKAGHQLSLQYHDQKHETLTLINGQANLMSGPNQNDLKSIPMQKETGYTITPNTIHRVKADTDTTIFEASTPEIGTTFRLQDDYQRQNETQQIRNSQRQND